MAQPKFRWDSCGRVECPLLYGHAHKMIKSITLRTRPNPDGRPYMDGKLGAGYNPLKKAAPTFNSFWPFTLADNAVPYRLIVGDERVATQSHY